MLTLRSIHKWPRLLAGHASIALNRGCNSFLRINRFRPGTIMKLCVNLEWRKLERSCHFSILVRSTKLRDRSRVIDLTLVHRDVRVLGITFLFRAHFSTRMRRNSKEYFCSIFSQRDHRAVQQYRILIFPGKLGSIQRRGENGFNDRFQAIKLRVGSCVIEW